MYPSFQRIRSEFFLYIFGRVVSGKGGGKPAEL